MKRLALASILISAGAYVACTVDEATPPNDTATGGTGAPSGGAAGNGQGGTVPTGGTTGGAAGSGVGGTTGGTLPTGGAAGAAPTGGAAGAPIGGTGGDISTGGMGGDISTGGMGGELLGGMGGMTGGTAGMGGALLGGMGGMTGGNAGTGMGGAGTTGCPECTAVGTPLDTQTILMPCGMNTETRVCIPMADTSRPCTDPGGSAASYSGTHSFNQQITLGGTTGVMYRMTLRIRGMMEAKTYSGGMDRTNAGTQVPADGLYTGGVANNSGNGYNIYFIRTDSPRQHYYLNSIAAGNDTRIRHSVFDTDFTFDVVAAGGSTVCLVSADPNTSAIKNCAEPDVGGQCNPVTLQNLDPLIAAKVGNMPYNGQFVGIRVTNVVRM
jgi:hypothetical protein